MSEQYPSRQQVAQAWVDALGLSRTPAVIVDYDPFRAGYLIVVSSTQDGTLLRQSLPNKAVVPVQPGMGVLLAREPYKRRLVVKEPDFDQQLATGVNPHVNNPADRFFYGATNQSTIQTLFCGALGTDAHPSMEVAIHPWMWRGSDGVFHELSEQRFDMTDPAGDGSEDTLVPDGATHRLVCLWVTEDNLITWTTSEPQSLVDDIDISDANECEEDAEVTWSPIRFWRLYGGMTNLRESDGWRDARQVLNVGAGGGTGASDFDFGQMRELLWIG